jgi:hypothetical protein
VKKNPITGMKQMDFIWLLLIFAGWFVLNRWVLPRFGVKT